MKTKKQKKQLATILSAYPFEVVSEFITEVMSMGLKAWIEKDIRQDIEKQDIPRQDKKCPECGNILLTWKTCKSKVYTHIDHCSIEECLFVEYHKRRT